jgi:hypothetical protein
MPGKAKAFHAKAQRRQARKETKAVMLTNLFAFAPVRKTVDLAVLRQGHHLSL